MRKKKVTYSFKMSQNSLCRMYIGLHLSFRVYFSIKIRTFLDCQRWLPEIQLKKYGNTASGIMGLYILQLITIF